MSDPTEREAAQVAEDFQRLYLFAMLIQERVGSLPEKVAELMDRYPEIREHMLTSVKEMGETMEFEE